MDAEFLEQLKMMAEMDIPDKCSTNMADEPHADIANGLSVDISPALPIDIKEEYQMPAYLKEQMIERTKQPDMQPVSAKRKHSKRMELFLYSCKVSAAVAASLVIIITMSATQSTISNLSNRSTSVIEHLKQDKHETDDISSQSNNMTNEDSFSQKDISTEKEFSEPNRISQKINESSQSITNWLQDFPGKLFNYEE